MMIKRWGVWMVLAWVLPWAGRADLLVGYELAGTTAPTTMAPGVTAGNLGISNGRTVSFATDAVYGSGWGTSGGIDGQRYWTFTVAADPDAVNLSSLALNGYRTASGPAQWAVRWSRDNFTSDLASGVLDTTLATQTVPSSALAAGGTGGTGTTEFRLYGYGASSSSGRWYLDGVSLQGAVAAVPEPSTLGLAALGLVWGCVRRRRAASEGGRS